SFTAPVLDCWLGFGDGPAAALEDVLAQWTDGAYCAYHDALAHNDAPCYEVEIGGTCWHAFEASIQARGSQGDVLQRTAEAGLTRALLSAPDLRLSPFRAHRIRWVHGMASEVMLDDRHEAALTDHLRTLDWPTPIPPLVRHSVVLLPHD